MFVWRVFPGRAEARPGAFLTVPALGAAGLSVAFTGRAGGAPGRTTDALNLTYLAGDDPERVAANRARVLECVGADPGAWTSGRQVHGTGVARAGRAERGRGAFDAEDAIPGVDAVWTDEPGVALAVLVADCVPILLADADARRIAVVHAGWRGLVAGVAQKAVAALEEAGSDPSRLRAFVGPSIGPCHYDVGTDVAAQARDALGPEVVVENGAAQRLDLWGGARAALRAAGVASVWPSALCTRCEPHRFFSHRAGDAGRQALVAVIV